MGLANSAHYKRGGIQFNSNFGAAGSGGPADTDITLKPPGGVLMLGPTHNAGFGLAEMN